MRSGAAIAFSICTALVWLVSADTTFAQADPSSLPARDSHEGLLVAADPWADAERYKARFGKQTPYDAGILAIDIHFRNDTDKPIRLDLESIRLLLSPPGSDRQKLEPLPLEDIVDRILNKRGPSPSTPRVPIQIPGRGPKTGRGKQWEQLAATVRGAAFDMDVLPPHSPVHGLVFFDVNHRYDWVTYARLYVPSLQFLPEKKALLYFEVDLAAARPR